MKEVVRIMLIKIKNTNTKYLGCVVWITRQKKVFRSGKRFDAFESWFKHDSVRVGELEQVYPIILGHSDILKLLEKGSIFGLFLEEQTCFFETWQEVWAFGQDYFKEYDERKDREKKAERLRFEAERLKYQEGQKRLQQEQEQQYWNARNKALDLHKRKSGLFSLFAQPFREANCFRCRNYLFSSTHSTCKDCGWIICDCGSCGCNYNQQANY